MRINTRFAVAVHLMALLALLEQQGKDAGSELLAASVGTNPVVIRQMMTCLKKAGLITTRSGLPGGRLARVQEEISLLDIYKAVQKEEDASLFDFHPNPNPKCFVGANIQGALEAPMEEAQAALEKVLEAYSLKDITAYIIEKLSLIHI